MAKRNFEKGPLYRKVNTRVRDPRRVHTVGGDFRHERNTKTHSDPEHAPTKRGMGKKERRGLDYTPLFRFLLSRVGKPWSDTFAEAQRRLDKPDPIHWMVRGLDDLDEPYVRLSESSYWSKLYVDNDGVLRKVDPNFGPENFPTPTCTCCTHSFNGKALARSAAPEEEL